MGFEEYKRAIAQVCNASLAIKGTGFCIAPNYVLTCAHVVNQALAGEKTFIGLSVNLRFPFLDEIVETAYPAEVIYHEYGEADDGRDVAVLYLKGGCLSNVIPIPLASLYRAKGAEVDSFGFVSKKGLNLTAITDGQVGGGWVQLKAPGSTGVAVESGASGSPVWCNAAAGAIGMIVAKDTFSDKERIGFFIPIEKLESALSMTKCHELRMILEPHQQELAQQILTAYKVCRPSHWPHPLQTRLSPILSDLTQMTSGELAEPKTVQFAACLFNQLEIDVVRNPLITWITNNTSNLDALLRGMETQQEKAAPRLALSYRPHLFISIQPANVANATSYRLVAWLIRDTNAYTPATGVGADVLTVEAFDDHAEERQLIDPEAVSEKQIPRLLAAYLDEVGKESQLQDLTIEFFLPLSLVNWPIEQTYIPADFGFDFPLGIGDACPHVVVRTQERLEFKRGLAQWREKWDQLQTGEKTKTAAQVFIKGEDNLRQLQSRLKSALGLKLTQLPKVSKQGEIALLIATGVPAALWLRFESGDVEWEARLDQQVLVSSVENLPQQVLALRRATPVLESEADIELSQELGHHLSFLWENPDHVPPDLLYSDATL